MIFRCCFFKINTQQHFLFLVQQNVHRYFKKIQFQLLLSFTSYLLIMKTSVYPDANLPGDVIVICWGLMGTYGEVL